MTNRTLEYIISLKDKYSAVAAKVNSGANKIQEATEAAGRAAERASNKFTGFFNRTSGDSNRLKNSLEDLRKRMELAHTGMQRTTNRNAFRFYHSEAQRLERQIRRLESGITGSGIGATIAGWRRDFASSLPGAEFIRNPLTLATASIGGFWVAAQKAMDAGKEKMKMQVLTGSQEIGAALYDGLTKFATDTVFGNEVYDMGAQMLANGIAESEVLPLMQRLGDISMGNAQNLQSLSLAYSQINSAGKLMGQDLMQLVNAGFNPLQVISEKTGESMASLKDKMSKGLITVDDVRHAIELATSEGGKFHNMLEQVANTPYGQLEGLRGQLEQMVVTIGEAFLPVATAFMSAMSWIGEKAGPILQPLAVVLGVVSVALLGLAAAQWAVNLAMWANPITWIVAGVAALIAIIILVIQKYDEWGAAVLTLLGPLGYLISIIKNLYDHWESIKEAFTDGGILRGFERIRLVIINAMLKPLEQIIKLVNSFDPTGMTDKAMKWISDWRAGHDLYTDKEISKMTLGAHNELMKSLGIAAPEGVPGAVGGAPRGGLGQGDAGKSMAKTNASIATGGTKHNYITINLKDLIGTLNIEGKSFRETTAEMEQQVIDALLRVTASATTAAQ